MTALKDTPVSEDPGSDVTGLLCGNNEAWSADACLHKGTLVDSREDRDLFSAHLFSF